MPQASLETRIKALEKEVARFKTIEKMLVEVCRRLGHTVTSDTGVRVGDTDAAQSLGSEGALPAPTTDRTTKCKILLMEDDDMIRSITGQKLNRLGYSADFARDGETALEKYTAAFQAGDPYDVVILDLMIEGGMGGRDVIRALMAFDPQVRAVVSTGYINDPIMANIYEYGFKAAVNKPFTVQQLETAIHKALKN